MFSAGKIDTCIYEFILTPEFITAQYMYMYIYILCYCTFDNNVQSLSHETELSVCLYLLVFMGKGTIVQPNFGTSYFPYFITSYFPYFFSLI